MTTPPPDEAPRAAQVDVALLEAAMAAIDALPRRRDQLLPALLVAQEALGWLPRDAISMVAGHIRVPVSEVYATATAYSELRLSPHPPGLWHVCTGTACDLAGARGVLDAAGGRAAPIDCRFLCALAPVVEDEHDALFGRATPEAMRELLASHPVEQPR